MSRSLTLHVAVHGDPSEVKCLRFVWFKESKTLFEFYGAGCSLRQKIENVRWFPKELPSNDPERICKLFESPQLSGSILWNYIQHASHILESQWNKIGVGKMDYLDKYCADASTKTVLMQNICKVIIQAILHIQTSYHLCA
jgi:hypothetical protein